MSSIRFTIPEPGRGLSDTFTNVPAYVIEQFKRGFAGLAKVKESSYADLLDKIKESFISRRPVKESDIASKLNISSEDARELMAAAGMAAVTIATAGTTANEFVEAGIKAGIITESDKDSVIKFTKAIENNLNDINRALQTARLNTESLPLLDEFETNVDVRLSFNNDQVGLALPMVLMRVSTDESNAPMLFQLTKQELENMIEKLQDTLRRLEQTEKWIGRS